MDIEVLTVTACPHRQTVLDRLEAALAVLGSPSARITERVIDDPAEAGTAGMRGSPTLLLDGRDLFASQSHVSVSCRLYRSADGFDGAPSVDELVGAMAHWRADASEEEISP